MKHIWYIVICIFLLSVLCESGSAHFVKNDIKFVVYDLYVDSGNADLAAWQVELNYNKDIVKLVGIEGASKGAFKNPPYYDRIGMDGGKIILAAFNTEDSILKSGTRRVARLHLAIKGGIHTKINTIKIIAAKPGGGEIQAKAKVKLFVGGQEI